MELLETIVSYEVPAKFAEVIAAETAGNPFFLREILLHLLEEGQLEPADRPLHLALLDGTNGHPREPARGDSTPALAPF